MFLHLALIQKLDSLLQKMNVMKKSAMINNKLFYFLFIGLFFSCSISGIRRHKEHSGSVNHSQIKFTILQFNDFYEIAPLEGGKIGGAARIATIRNKLIQENPNTYTVLAGDFLSPSLLGTLKFEGERIRGKQMIEVLNVLGLDLAAFGNHEFDIDESALLKRINESKFDWVSSNILHKTAQGSRPFVKQIEGNSQEIPKYKIVTFRNKSNDSVRVGFISPCLPANPVKFVEYEDIFASVEETLKSLESKVDFVVLLSHLTKEDDRKMGERFPQINLILGGHEHDHMLFKAGKALVTKADANAKTVYVHRITFDSENRKATMDPELVTLNESVVLDGKVNLVVEKWKSIENKLMREMGFDPEEQLLTLAKPYDAREVVIRNIPSAFCKMITKSMSTAYPESECAIMNSGSIRVDDVLLEKLSQYDILRSMPYGGSVLSVKMKGSLLKKILDIGWTSKGRGAFLQWDRIDRTETGNWLIQEKVLEENRDYRVAMNEFLMTGLESGLDFLKEGNKEILEVVRPAVDQTTDFRRDIRLVVIDYLKKGGR